MVWGRAPPGATNSSLLVGEPDESQAVDAVVPNFPFNSRR